MPRGINRAQLRERRLGALVRLEEQKPKNEKHEKYIKKEIERVKARLDHLGGESKWRDSKYSKRKVHNKRCTFFNPEKA